MSQFIRINSQLDALRMKEFEKKFYEKLSDNVKIVPKVTPFKGINTDLMYIKDNKISMGIALRHFDIACNKFGLEVDYSKIDVKKRMAKEYYITATLK